jgi:Ca-activated chloride channel homolog
MITPSRHARRAAMGFATFLFWGAPALHADESKPPPCKDDAMIVFDASGSMAGNVDQGIATIRPRIDEVRAAVKIDVVRTALAQVLPNATRLRKVGLISLGPGPWNRCNVQLNLKPTADAADSL